LRLPLSLRLFSLTALATLAAVLVLFAVQQHSFREGLLDHANRQAAERAESLLPLLIREHRNGGGWERLRGNPRLFRRLNDEALGLPPGPPPGRRRDGPGMGPGPFAGGRGPGLPPDSVEEAAPRRFALYDADGVAIIGPPRPAAGALEFPVLDGERRIATLTMLPMPRLENALDIEFAQAQWRTGLYAAMAVLLLALAAALLGSRWLAAPLKAMAGQARRIADGDYAARLHSQRSDEIGSLARDLDAMAAALEQHRQARQRWTAEISHELRTPVAILRGEIEALQDGVRPFDAAALASFDAEVRRLGRLVEDLYQLSLADAGALAYRFEECELATLIDEALDAEREAISRAGLGLETDLIATARVRADRDRLRQLLGNLIANALRYTDAPGNIRIATQRSGQRIELIVEDTPPGVPPEALPRLFDPLFRVEASRSRAAGGAGLGLAIVSRIAQAHEASVLAEPSPLGGLRVGIAFPIR
jgi:two-component system sensor histidine kinase BaeS